MHKCQPRVGHRGGSIKHRLSVIQAGREKTSSNRRLRVCSKARRRLPTSCPFHLFAYNRYFKDSHILRRYTSTMRHGQGLTYVWNFRLVGCNVLIAPKTPSDLGGTSIHSSRPTSASCCKERRNTQETCCSHETRTLRYGGHGARSTSQTRRRVPPRYTLLTQCP